jgi:hypothetical protein
MFFKSIKIDARLLDNTVRKKLKSIEFRAKL